MKFEPMNDRVLVLPETKETKAGAMLLSLGYLRQDGSVSFPCDNEQAETRRLA